QRSFEEGGPVGSFGMRLDGISTAKRPGASGMHRGHSGEPGSVFFSWHSASCWRSWAGVLLGSRLPLDRFQEEAHRHRHLTLRALRHSAKDQKVSWMEPISEGVAIPAGGNELHRAIPGVARKFLESLVQRLEDRGCGFAE